MREYNCIIAAQRLLFAFVIVLFHGHHFTDSSYYLFMGGAIAVDFFFLLSGAMLGRTIDNTLNSTDIGTETLLFMKHRITRLVPEFYVAWLIGGGLDAINYKSVIEFMKRLITSAGEFLLIDQSGFLNVRFNDTTWYISALLIVSFIIYPIAIKDKNRFFFIISPLGFILLFGYTYQNWESITVLNWNGLCYNTLIRGAMGIFAGCICYRIARYLMKFKFKTWVRIFISMLSWFPIIAVLSYALFHNMTVWSWYIFLMFMVSLIATLTNQGIEKTLISEKASRWCNEFAYTIYLGHGPWRWFLKSRLPETWGYYRKILFYILISAVTALVIMYTSKVMKKIWSSRKKIIGRWFILR